MKYAEKEILKVVKDKKESKEQWSKLRLRKIWLYQLSLKIEKLSFRALALSKKVDSLRCLALKMGKLSKRHFYDLLMVVAGYPEYRIGEEIDFISSIEITSQHQVSLDTIAFNNPSFKLFWTTLTEVRRINFPGNMVNPFRTVKCGGSSFVPGSWRQSFRWVEELSVLFPLF